MDPIEKAIRNAFAKGDPRDPAFREKVYRSAAEALDRALKANPSTTVERAIARRKTMESTIAAVEAEFLHPLPETDDVADLDFSAGNRAGIEEVAPEIAVDGRRAPAGRVGRTRETTRIEPSLAEPDLDIPTRSSGEGDPDAGNIYPEARNERRTGARAASALVSVLFLGLIGAGGWWLVDSGLLPLNSLLGLSTPNATDGEGVTTGEEESVAGPLSESRETRAWINIFNPQDPSTVSAAAGAESSVQVSEGLKLLRIRSGEPGEPIRFAVGQGVLEQLAGKTAIFDIVARAEEDGGNFSVTCDFGSFGECRRKRYAANSATRGDFLFEVDLPAGRPARGGTIMIDPDVTGGGKAVDIFEIRASPSD